MSYYEVMRQSLELSETMLNGIEHIRWKLAAGHFEEMLSLLQDVTEALVSIQEGGQQVAGEMKTGNPNDNMERLLSALDELVSAYESKDWEQALKAMENQVVPGFIAWKEELERCYRPAVVS